MDQVYFAFGSNMLQSRLERRVGPVQVIGLGELRGFCHDFSKHGNDGSGKGNIEPSSGEAVLGVLYRLSNRQLTALDEFEGGYQRIAVRVHPLTWDSAHSIPARAPTRAQTFQALRPVPAIAPTAEYVEYYAAGMRQHDFPEPYRRAILDRARALMSEP